MDTKVRNSVVTGQNAQRYYTKAVSRKEVLIVIGLQFIFRGRKNISSIEEQFQLLPPIFTKWPIQEKRYMAIMSSLDCNFDELSSLLRESWKEAIEPGTHFSVDETLYSYNSTNDVTSPQRYIPRKPHKNGLLSYMSVFKTNKGPYVFDLEPDYKIDALNARVALKKIVQRWNWQNTPHVVVDAGFSGDSARLTVGDMQCYITSSINVAHNKTIFDGLKLFCPLSNWLAIKDQNGGVWSLYRGKEEEGEHFLCTTAFTDDKKPIKSQPMKENDIYLLSKVGLRALSALGNMIGVTLSGDPMEIARSIASKINEGSNDNHDSEVENENPGPLPSTSSREVEPSEDYSSMKLKELGVIARDMNIKTAGKKKDELVSDIIKMKKITADDVQNTIQSLSQASKNSSAPHHSIYRSEFNGIDLHDKEWYKQINHHTIVSWRSKFTMSLVMSGIVNSHVMYRHFEDLTLIKYCERLSQELCKEE